MKDRYRGQMVRKYGLICGPHPDKCVCCRTVAYTDFKRLQRRSKRVMAKRECRAMVHEYVIDSLLDREETDSMDQLRRDIQTMIQLERAYALAFPYRYQFDAMV